MLRSILFLFLLSFLVTTPTVAQSSFFNVNETKPFKDTKRNTSLEQLFRLSNGNMVAVRSAKKRLMVTAFGENYQIDNDVEIELERKQTYVGSVQDGNSIHSFTITRVDKETKDINVHTYTAGSRSVSTKKLYTATKDEKRVSKFGSLVSRKHDENFRVSPNGEFIAFAVENIDSKTNAFSIRVFDRSLNEVYNTNYIDSEEKYYAFDDFIVSNQGEVLSAGKLYNKGRREKRKGEANYDYIVYSVSANGSDSFQFDLGDNFVKELSFAQADDGEIRLIGFYSERNSRRMKGAVSYSFSGMDVQTMKATEVPFPEKLFKDLYTEKKASRLAEKEKELFNYYLDYVLVDEQGNGYLLAEQFYVTYQTTGGGMNGAMMTTPVYHYDNILVIKFNPEGNLEWARSILKKDNSFSYNAFVLDNRLHVFLNSGKNLGEKSDGRTKVRRGFLMGSALYDITFNPADGEQSYEQIQENRGKETFIPFKGTFTADAIVLPNLSKRKKSFLVLTQK